MLMPSDYGRPDLKPFLVAKKSSTTEWDNELPEIVSARKCFEAGTHTLCTRYVGGTQLLYCIPQQEVTPRRGYFTLRMSDGRLA